MNLFIAIVNMIAFVVLAFYAWASYELQRATRASTETERDKLEQFRDAYETRIAPELTAEVELRGDELRIVALHLKNVGNTDARRVRMRFEPPMSSDGRNRPTFEDGLDRLASGDEFDAWLDRLEQWNEGEAPTRLECHLHWEDDEGGGYDKTVVLDVSASIQLSGSLDPAPADALADRVDELEERIDTLGDTSPVFILASLLR
jgi:hypothetical protein